MKRIKSLSAVFLLFAFFTISCSDVEPIDPAIVINPQPENPGNPGNPGNPATPGSFKVDFDGNTYTATSTLVYISGGSIILNAVRSDGASFGMILDGTTTGTYPTNGNLVAYTPAGSEYGWEGNHPTDASANTGSVIITQVNTTNRTISGTFSFTGYWTDFDQTVPNKAFTNGVFTNLPYVSQNPTGDTFSAKINGVEYIDTDILTVETQVNSLEVLSIGTEDAAGQGITVTMKTNLGSGTYVIDSTLEVNGVQINYTPAGEVFGTSAAVGVVTITEKTALRIKGTFSGTVTIEGAPYQITAGAFDVAY